MHLYNLYYHNFFEHLRLVFHIRLKKQILIDFIISKNNPVLEQYEESSDDMGEILESMFTEPEESVNELFLATIFSPPPMPHSVLFQSTTP